MSNIEHPMLDVMEFCDEQDEIMDETKVTKDKYPNDLLEYGTARLLNIYVLRAYAKQKGIPFVGRWKIDVDGEEVCSVCRTSRKHSELEGTCVTCGAKMMEESE